LERLFKIIDISFKMSLKANVSIILQIHSFKNLALPHKARYALVAQIYQGKPEKVNYLSSRIQRYLLVLSKLTPNIERMSADKAQ
jgi:hypothetical protein